MSRPADVLLETIIALLLPHFAAAAANAQDARTAIIETLASYGSRTNAELLQAAQIIALGMTALDVLSEAKAADSPARIRLRRCANGLNRAAVQTQKALDQRLAGDAPDRHPPPMTERPPNRQVARTSRGDGTLPDRDKQLWAGAMIDTLKQMGLSVQATHDPGG